MAETYGRLAGSPSAWLRSGYMRSPVIWTWLGLALLLSGLAALGFRPNNDLDDVLKLHEIRFVLTSGNIFERTLPGILQPEPFVTHWPVLVDIPYVLVAWVLKPIIGLEASLAAASYAVPLLLLGPAVYFFYRIISALDFVYPAIVLPLAAVFAFRSFAEFAPGRIDYHNLEVLLLLASLSLILTPGRIAALANGFVTALALAVSLEFALFFSLVLGIYAADFVLSARDGASRLSAFGLALAATAAMLFVITVPPAAYGVAACDTYSAPHLTALVCAGLSFTAAPMLVRGHDTPVRRAAVLVVLAAASVAMLVLLFPQCLGGPYAGVSDYLRDNWLDRIGQEKSLFARRDFVLSSGILPMTILFIGALAPAVISTGDRGGNRALLIFTLSSYVLSMIFLFVGALAPAAVSMRERGRNRPLLIITLFSLLALAHAILYFRYIRYLPIFSGLGLAFLFAVIVPASSKFSGSIGIRSAAGLQSKYLLFVPGLVLSAAIVLFHLVASPAEPRLAAAQVADRCDFSSIGAFDWPAGTRVLSPPLIGIHLLSPQPGQAVVAIPFHAAAPGIERAYRFLDPATADPRAVLDAAQATHVAVCAWRAGQLPEPMAHYPFAASLMEGRPPSWLAECPAAEASPLRIYRYRNAGQPELACPARP